MKKILTISPHLEQHVMELGVAKGTMIAPCFQCIICEKQEFERPR